MEDIRCFTEALHELWGINNLEELGILTNEIPSTIQLKLMELYAKHIMVEQGDLSALMDENPSALFCFGCINKVKEMYPELSGGSPLKAPQAVVDMISQARIAPEAATSSKVVDGVVNIDVSEGNSVGCPFCNMIIPPESDLLIKHLESAHNVIATVVDKVKKRKVSVSNPLETLAGPSDQENEPEPKTPAKPSENIQANKGKFETNVPECFYGFDSPVLKKRRLKVLVKKPIEFIVKKPIEVLEKQSGPPKDLECQLCDRTFQKIGGLIAHIQEHGRRGNFICSVCEAMFTTSALLYKHQEEYNHGYVRPQFVCKVCSESFKVHADYAKHVKTHYQCEVCSFYFETVEEYREHITKHDVEDETKKFKCHICEGSYTNIKYFRRHMLEKHSDKKIHCDICQAVFATEKNMQRHRVIHERDGGGLKCEICNEKFIKRDSLRQHRKCHNRVNCPTCNKELRQSSLTEHMRVHSGVKQHSCDLCGREFRFIGDKYKHMRRMHSGIKKVQSSKKKYKCKHCFLAFEQLSRLKRHERTHTNVGPFVCDICGSGFMEMRNLTNHLLLHRKEKNQQNVIISEDAVNSLYLIPEGEDGERRFLYQIVQE